MCEGDSELWKGRRSFGKDELIAHIGHFKGNRLSRVIENRGWRTEDAFEGGRPNVNANAMPPLVV